MSESSNILLRPLINLKGTIGALLSPLLSFLFPLFQPLPTDHEQPHRTGNHQKHGSQAA